MLVALLVVCAKVNSILNKLLKSVEVMSSDGKRMIWWMRRIIQKLKVCEHLCSKKEEVTKGK